MSQRMLNQVDGCYLHYREITPDKNPGGIEKKVTAQIKAFNDSGISCDFILCKQPETTGSKVLSCLPFFSDRIEWPDPESMSKYSFIYMRRPRFASKELIHFIKATKKRNPDIKIIYEVPTYPYDDEMKTPVLYPALLKDRANRKQLKKCVDRIAGTTTREDIFCIPVLPMINGIDLSSIKPKKPSPSLNEINIIVVARFERWHGLDRLISGTINYFKGDSLERNVVLHVVGTGSVIEALKREVENSHFERSIVFHGYCGKEELNEIYDKCSLAVESLGFHRIGLTTSSTLKSREYLAKGIPFVCANATDVFINNPVDFCLRIPADESPVDIQTLLDFHDQLYASESQESLIYRIRKFAETHIGINQTMERIVNYIKEVTVETQ